MRTHLRNMMAAIVLVSAVPLRSQTPPATPPQDPIAANDPAFMADYAKQYRDAFRDGAIPAKYKQLSGITLSVVIKCEECLKSHVQSAIKLGANRKEIVEALRIGLLTGGSAGLPTMAAAYPVMDDAKPG